MDNRLVLMDQAFYAGHQAAGQNEVMQVAWIYERPIDMDKLKRFHHDLAYGLLGRRIERSPLPFGRYRWVWDKQPTELDVAESPRPRSELADWLEERSQLPIDPERGPGWRLSVVSFTDGTAAATLVISHYVVDGIGAVVGVALASMGDTSGQGYPPPRSRRTLQAILEDTVDTAREIPAVAKSLVAAAKEARRRRTDDSRQQPTAPPPALTSTADTSVTVPSAWVRMDMDVWNARAEALGGSGSTLAVALTAKLDELMGRSHGDTNDVKVLLLVNERTLGDVRAVAVSFARLSIDPSDLTSDLTAARTAVKKGLAELKETRDESTQFVALTPFTPRRAWIQLVEHALNDPDQPAVCSNLGDTGPAVIRPDGEPCDSAFARGTSQHMTQQWLDRIGSQLNLYFGTSVEMNKVGLHIRGYHPGSVTTKAELMDLVERTLHEFGLTGLID
ncbi:hypothetical protein MANY_23380 [Mycolicibacterium anyangense]|uniref:Diacylglycerol O-acyltransferase n=1 Tax=Mycolicibacterium anyangense TaxID=1431246 RepID=A0A6N4WCR5_9MYCO|nr:hypothetical protein [Mycolicibacterium anyangense]BBZ77001.1 hypothetical protein MANY_23380 [Mycolicibacterium anyangense]